MHNIYIQKFSWGKICLLSIICLKCYEVQTKQVARYILFLIIFLTLIGFLFVVAHQSTPQPTTLFGTPTPDISQMAGPFTTLQPKSNQNTADQQAQQQTEQQQLQAALEEIKKASISATITTTKGDITVEFYEQDAPISVFNFVQKAKAGFYNNKTFHRVEDWVTQGGDPNGDGTGGGNIPVEFNQRPFIVGSLGQASRGDGQVQNDSQFFITKSDASWLNGKYTNYGMVTSGMDVVNNIEIGDKIQNIVVNQQ